MEPSPAPEPNATPRSFFGHVLGALRGEHGKPFPKAPAAAAGPEAR